MEVVSALLLLSFMLYLLWMTTTRSKQLPPGPRPLPLIGNLLQFDMHNPLKDFSKVGPVSTTLKLVTEEESASQVRSWKIFYTHSNGLPQNTGRWIWNLSA